MISNCVLQTIKVCVHIVKDVCFLKNVFEFITANSGLTSGSKRMMTVVLLGKISISGKTV